MQTRILKTKIVLGILMLVCFSTNVLAFFGGDCTFVSCSQNISSSKKLAERKIKLAYEKLHNEIDKLKIEYQKQVEKLEAQNKLLEDYKAILKFSNLQYAEMIFYLQKFNKLQNNKNSLEGVKR